jgi:hypothetical protein
VVSAEEAEVVYDGPGESVWQNAGKIQKNGQRTISISKLRKIASAAKQTDDIFGFLAGRVTIIGDIVSPAFTPEEWGDLYPDSPPSRRKHKAR